MTIVRSRCRCTSNSAYTTCQHPCTLTDSNTGDGTVNSTDYFLWRFNASNPRILLFTFPQIVLLHTITLYYYIDRRSNVDPVLQFFAAIDNFDLLLTTENNILIESITVCENGSDPRNRSLSFDPKMMRKLLVTKNFGGYRFGLSEVEFFTDCGKLHSHTTSAYLYVSQ